MHYAPGSVRSSRDIHCDTEQQARDLMIVYCKDTNRRDEAEHTADFLAFVSKP